MANKQPRQRQIAQRCCVSCRQQFDKRDLTRIVRTADDGVVVDRTGKRNGRGAYLCVNPDCWYRARRQKSVDNALKTTLSEDEWTAILTQMPAARKDVIV